ncbi:MULTISPECIES: alpha/beta hydrolase [Nocardioides]|uniref:Alpha/beta hydrolase n=1 Tax=Nocardioides vastitatis TaxID=2568655 RepID=A0ABW0ZHM9_9ACTN|nr:alpha/beta fold hydrolase [Nocardioides sp.]THI93720.1 alpha/beta hydrolase [Nocardioides sp.]
MTGRASGREPSLADVRLPDRVRAVVLVLHGGAEQDDQPVDGRSLSWRRGRQLARDIAPPLAGDGIGVVLLRYRMRGWNVASDGMPAPVADARWALDELARRHGRPVALVGHSMGARTAVAVAAHASVHGVVALAPWFPRGEPVEPLRAKALRAAHGRRDHVTSAGATRQYVERAHGVCDATFTDMGDVGHYLLRRVAAWNAIAVAGVREVLAAR